MIWFVLSYMKGGDAELWANAYVDQALENNDWGVWEDFLDKLAKDFGNKGERRKALKELGRLQQNKRTAAEYFLKLEQLADVAGVDLDHYLNATLYVERNMQRALIDQLYQTDHPPTTYQEYKRRITAMDKMRRRREPYNSLQRTRSRTQQPWMLTDLQRRKLGNVLFAQRRDIWPECALIGKWIFKGRKAQKQCVSDKSRFNK
jgi:hypothetical protein